MSKQPIRFFTKAFLCLTFLTVYVPTSLALTEFPPDLGTTNHLAQERCFSWGIHWLPGIVEIIVSSELSLEDVNRWRDETNDRTTRSLLDIARESAVIYYDESNAHDNMVNVAASQLLTNTHQSFTTHKILQSQLSSQSRKTISVISPKKV